MSWDDLATGPQIHRIALLADLVGITYPTEEREMSKAQAKNEIYLLSMRLRIKNKAKHMNKKK